MGLEWDYRFSHTNIKHWVHNRLFHTNIKDWFHDMAKLDGACVREDMNISLIP